MIHLSSVPEHVRWGRLPCAASRPVAELEDGESVTIDTVSHEGILPDQGSDPVAFFSSLGIAPEAVLEDARQIASGAVPRDPLRDGPHVVTGPIAIKHARPGDVVRVEVLGQERRADYGIVSNRHGRGVLAGEFPLPDEDGATPPIVCRLARVGPDGRGSLASPVGHSLSFALREFLGLVGVATATATEVSSTPPGPHGGNLDIWRFGIGTSLLLPVQVEGALLYVGDPHYAQGNGEVALTAFEAPLRSTLRIHLEQGAAARRLSEVIGHPVIETRNETIVVGLGATLDDAMSAAVRHAIALVTEHTGVDRATALAYLSVAADFEVSQAVNGVRGIHCLIPRRDLSPILDG